MDIPCFAFEEVNSSWQRLPVSTAASLHILCSLASLHQIRVLVLLTRAVFPSPEVAICSVEESMLGKEQLGPPPAI